ncbi:hypothetical protein D4765_16010 [Subtercola vilae]|uniref:Uncharacterized protein n=1 Tax=Subtercola vilae TaxID=2056433 RepID=A0A4T2BMJ9_9MICO|nr:hypothetical protein D4765_16010 [Subtercola vilae]
MSRPTTCGPRPRANTVAASVPETSSARMRLASVTVTVVPWLSTTVVGSCGVGAGVRAAMLSLGRQAVDAPVSSRGGVVG